jgi:hypothetical protein
MKFLEMSTAFESPYVSMSNCPTLYMDPLGDKIIVKESTGSKKLKYEDGKLYKRKFLFFGWKECQGDDKFAKRVASDLNSLQNEIGIEDPTSEENIVTSLQNSNRKHVIKSHSSSGIGPRTNMKRHRRKNRKGKSVGSTILYNSKSTKCLDGDRDPIVGLSHELQHAYDYDQGRYVYEHYKTTYLGSGKETKIRKSEVSRKHTLFESKLFSSLWTKTWKYWRFPS